MLVSVIIPCYNVQDFIEECLDSVFKQSYHSIEVICVDNNSSDKTLQILQKLKSENTDKITVVSQIKKGGNAARNMGLSLARGEWIQFLDADDLLLPTKIENQIKLLDKHNDISFIAGACIFEDGKGKRKGVVFPEKSNSLFNVFIKPSGSGNTCSNLWSRHWLNAIDGWDESLFSSQETDLMFRILIKNNKIITDEKPLTIIRHRETGRISHTDPSSRWVSFINSRLNHLELLKENYPEMYKQHYSEFCTFMVSSILTLNNYNNKLAFEFMQKLNCKKSDLIIKYGLSKKAYIVISIFGFRLSLRLFSKLSRSK